MHGILSLLFKTLSSPHVQTPLIRFPLLCSTRLWPRSGTPLSMRGACEVVILSCMSSFLSLSRSESRIRTRHKYSAVQSVVERRRGTGIHMNRGISVPFGLTELTRGSSLGIQIVFRLACVWELQKCVVIPDPLSSFSRMTGGWGTMMIPAVRRATPHKSRGSIRLEDSEMWLS